MHRGAAHWGSQEEAELHGITPGPEYFPGGGSTRTGRIKENIRDKESSSHSWNPGAAWTRHRAGSIPGIPLERGGQVEGKQLRCAEERECGSILGQPGEMVLWVLRG